MNLGATIKNTRKRLGISQIDLADKCNMSQAYLSQIENNQKDPNLSTIKNIAENLGIPLPILFFISLEETDVSENKREAFKIIGPSAKSMLNEFFTTTN